MVRAKSIRDFDDLRPAPPVGGDLERGHRWVTVGEGDDVGHVRAAPLVDGLLVVADHAQFDLRAGQQLDQPFLGRVDVLVLVHDQVAELGVDLSGQLRAFQLPHRPHDLLAVGEQPVALKSLVVGAQHRPERVGHRGRVEQLVLDHVHALEERGYRGEQPALLVELPEFEPGRLPGQERGELVVVQHVVGLVPRHALLQQAEAERVDRADEQPRQPVQRRRAQACLPPGGRSGSSAPRRRAR